MQSLKPWWKTRTYYAAMALLVLGVGKWLADEDAVGAIAHLWRAIQTIADTGGTEGVLGLAVAALRSGIRTKS